MCIATKRDPITSRMRRGDERLRAAERRRIGDGRAAVAVALSHEHEGHVVAEERDVGAVRAVGHAERAAGRVAGIARRLHLACVYVGKMIEVSTTSSKTGVAYDNRGCHPAASAYDRRHELAQALCAGAATQEA